MVNHAHWIVALQLRVEVRVAAAASSACATTISLPPPADIVDAAQNRFVFRSLTKDLMTLRRVNVAQERD
jgi:hypothetical protein